MEPTCNHQFVLETTGYIRFVQGAVEDTLQDRLICKKCGMELKDKNIYEIYQEKRILQNKQL